MEKRNTPFTYKNKVTRGGESFELDTFFNRVNLMYGNEKFVEKTIPTSFEQLQVRREALCAILENRIDFAINLALSNFRCKLNDNYKLDNIYFNTYSTVDYVKEYVHGIYDMNLYMNKDENQFNLIFNDIIMAICSHLYSTISIDSYSKETSKEIIESNKMIVDKFMLELYMELANLFTVIRQEVQDVYLKAGYNGMDFSNLVPRREYNPNQIPEPIKMSTDFYEPISVDSYNGENNIEFQASFEQNKNTELLTISYPKNYNKEQKLQVIEDVQSFISNVEGDGIDLKIAKF